MQNSGQRSSRIGLLLCCVAVAMLCNGVRVRVCHSAESDSGWAISAPPTLDPEVGQRFPSAGSSVRQLLNAKEPLIRIESNRVETQVRKPLSSLRIAERPSWQPSRPVRKTDSIGPRWEANNLSDFDLGEAYLKPVEESEESTSTMDDTPLAKIAIEEPSPPTSEQSPASESAPASIDTPMPQKEAVKRLDAVVESPLVPNPSSELTSEPSSEPSLPASEPDDLISKPIPVQKPVAKKDESPSAQTKTPPITTPPKKTTPKKKTPPKPKKKTPPKESPQPKPTIKLPVAKPLPPLSRNQQRLRGKMQHVLKSYYRRPLNSRDHDPWEIMHGMLAYGVYSRVLQNSPQGDPITAVGWLCYNKSSKQKKLLYINKQGELRARWGVGVQGHYGQFLAMLAQCRVDKSYPIRVGEEEFTIEDLIAAEQKTCQAGEELSFKLIALMHYCRSDTKWVNEQGSNWGIPRLIREELKQSIRGAPCGGTHRLSGLSLAVRTRIKRGEPLDGEYRRAQEFVERHERYALQFQNSDGSLSTEWFRGRGDDTDINRRIKTTGHILEWLLYSQNDDEIQSSRTFNAVNYLTNLMASNYSHDWEIGPLSHAIHALVLYDERVFQPHGEPESAKPSRPIATKQRQPRRQKRQRRQNVSAASKRRR